MSVSVFDNESLALLDGKAPDVNCSYLQFALSAAPSHEIDAEPTLTEREVD